MWSVSGEHTRSYAEKRQLPHDWRWLISYVAEIKRWDAIIRWRRTPARGKPLHKLSAVQAPDNYYDTDCDDPCHLRLSNISIEPRFTSLPVHTYYLRRTTHARNRDCSMISACIIPAAMYGR